MEAGSPDTLHAQRLAVVIVTFNRCDDLRQLLLRLQTMQEDFSHLVVVDNASTDGTCRLITSFQPVFGNKLIVSVMPENTGGAGGFHNGVKIASELPVDWIWLSDDDAIPQLDCFTTLLSAASSTDHVYGSTAQVTDSENGELCWPARQAGGKTHGPLIARHLNELEDQREVDMLPFLGFMVSREKVRQIGLPNNRYFISGDDMQYSIRLRRSGSHLFLVKASIVLHPRIPRYSVHLFGRRFDCLRMPPWRRRLDIRNRLWNARLKEGIPGVLLSAIALLPRVIFTLVHERPIEGQLAAYFHGYFAGLFQYHDSGNCD